MVNTSSKCPSVLRLGLFYQGRLTATEIDEVAGHLSQCASCLKQLEAMETLARETGDLDNVLPGLRTPDLAEEVQSLMADSSSEEQLLELVQFLQFSSNHDEYGSERYGLTRHLAEGPLCRTFLGHDDRTQPVVIRLPYPNLVASKIQQRRFLNDAAIQRDLNHPGILPTLDQGAWDSDQVYACQAIACGANLLSRLSTKDTWTFGRVVSTVQRIAEAIDFAHRLDPPLIHRHLHPRNVFVSEEGVVQVADFGWVFDGRYQMDLLEPNTLNNWYLAPEVVELSRMRVDPRSDIYSLGSLLAAICRRCADMDDSQKDRMRRLAMRCRSRSRARRPTDVTAFLTELNG